MKVRDLREALGELDGEMEVVAPSANFELEGAEVSTQLYVWTMSQRSERFRDAFDFEDYHTDVWRFDSNGQQVCRIAG